MKIVPYILGINQGVVKEMAGSSHTPASCLSKFRSSLEAGKKQLRVWLEYGCSVTEMLLFPSFRVPLVLLLSPYGQFFFNYPFHLAVFYVYPRDHIVTKISPTTKDFLIEYTRDLPLVLCQDFLEEIKGKYIKNKAHEED